MSEIRARVCIIAPEFIGPYPNGGVGTACYWEAVTLGRAGFDVTVLYTGATERQTAEHWEATYNGGPFSYVDLWRWSAGAGGGEVERVQQPCAEARTAELVYRFLARHQFDLLLFQEFLGHGARALQARHSGTAFQHVPAAVTLHSCRQWIYEGMRRLPASRDDLYVDFLERESARLADVVVAPSMHMARWAGAHWPLPSAPVVIPYCYDESLQRPAHVVRHEGPFKHLVFFGRLETRKGLHLLCRALANWPEARGAIEKVTFLGKNSTVEGRPSEEFIRRTLGRIDRLDVQIVNTLGSLEALQWLGEQKHTLVIAPSVVDNLPYAVIELFARRLPLIATRIGGIPEIVGKANDHILADATPEGIAEVLARVQRENALVIDYRDGYQIDSANAAHVEWARSMVGTRGPQVSRPAEKGVVVVVDATSETLAATRAAFAAADPTAGDFEFLTWNDWRSSSRQGPAIFTSSQVRPGRGLAVRLSDALCSTVLVATSYYASLTKQRVAMAPLGTSLDAGWSTNVFGGPCFIAHGTALDTMRGLPDPFAFWPAYAGLVCAGVDIAVIPECLYEASPVVETFAARERVVDIYRQSASERLDLGWVLKYAQGRSAVTGDEEAGGVPVGQALYDRILEIPDAQLIALSGLRWTPQEDPHVSDLRQLRADLAALAREWEDAHPRVFVYGAGQHARLLVCLEPSLGKHIAGFIDRRPIAEFLGKPCIRPEQLTAEMADVVLYASREYEREMYARLASLNVQHILLYTQGPERTPDTVASRLRRRFGHTDAPVKALRALYRKPSWVTGSCSNGDVQFLLEMVMGIAPRLVLELGVAAGSSSAALLFALDALPESATGRMLHSCDVRDTCYFDQTRRTGSAVQELYPSHRATWRLDTRCDARRIAATLPPGSVDLCFIDANHCHPWPLLDLLHVAPLLQPEGWIVLHDIELPRLHPEFQVHGPQWLFAAWPFNKIHGVGDGVNIGAVQLPANLSELNDVALALLERAWEHSPSAKDVDLPACFADVTCALKPRLAPAPAVTVAR